MEGKRVLDVADSHPLALDENTHDVEPVRVPGAAVTRDPDARRTSQLLLFTPVDRFDRTAEPVPAPSLDLDEGDHPIPLDHEVDVAMSGAEPALDHPPPPPPKPSLRNALSQLAE